MSYETFLNPENKSPTKSTTSDLFTPDNSKNEVSFLDGASAQLEGEGTRVYQGYTDSCCSNTRRLSTSFMAIGERPFVDIATSLAELLSI